MLKTQTADASSAQQVGAVISYGVIQPAALRRVLEDYAVRIGRGREPAPQI